MGVAVKKTELAEHKKRDLAKLQEALPEKNWSFTVTQILPCFPGKFS